MRKSWLLIALVSVLVLSVAFPIFAQERNPLPPQERRGERKGEGPFPNVNYSLNLSQEQKTQALNIWEKYRPDIRNLQGQIEEAYIALYKLSLETPSNEVANEIRAKIEEINSLKQKMQETRNTMFQEMLSLLTPEQTSQLAKEYPRRGGRGFTFQEGMNLPGMGFPANLK